MVSVQPFVTMSDTISRHKMVQKLSQCSSFWDYLNGSWAWCSDLLNQIQLLLVTSTRDTGSRFFQTYFNSDKFGRFAPLHAANTNTANKPPGGSKLHTEPWYLGFSPWLPSHEILTFSHVAVVVQHVFIHSWGAWRGQVIPWPHSVHRQPTPSNIAAQATSNKKLSVTVSSLKMQSKTTEMCWGYHHKSHRDTQTVKHWKG